MILKRVGFKLRKAVSSQNIMLAKLNMSYAERNLNSRMVWKKRQSEKEKHT